LGEGEAECAVVALVRVVMRWGIIHGRHNAIRAFIDFEKLSTTMEVKFDICKIYDHLTT